MRKTLIALTLLTIIGAAASISYLASTTKAHAGSHCTTTCNTVLGRQYCTTNCY